MFTLQKIDIPIRTTALLLFALLSSASVFSDEAFDFFVEVCRHSGYNPAEISTFQAELTVTMQSTYPDSYVSRMRQQEAEEELPVAGYTEEERQQSREAWEEVRRQRYSDKPFTRYLKVASVNTAAQLGLEDDLGQAIQLELHSKETDLFQVGSRVRDATHSAVGPQAKVSLNQFGFGTSVRDGSISPGMYYHLNGRSMSVTTMMALGRMLVREEKGGGFVITDAGKAAFKELCEKHELSFTLSKEKVQYDGDHYAYILEFFDKGRRLEQLWIDPDRGYICPRQKRFDIIDGSLRNDFVSENFILDEHSQKWFPQKTTHFNWEHTEQEVIERRCEINVTPGTLILNQPIPDSVFTLTIAQWEQILDTRRDDSKTTAFVAKQSAVLDLPTAEHEDFLDNADWIMTRPVRQHREPFSIENASFGWKRMVLMAVGVSMVILGIVVHFFKKLRSNQ